MSKGYVETSVTKCLILGAVGVGKTHLKHLLLFFFLLSNVSELRRFLGMINQFNKFSPRIADLTQPLRELLSARNVWQWSPKHDLAFAALKQEITKPSTLALYNPQVATKISTDASSYGLGAILLQEEQGSWKPVAFASKALTETEQRYAQIEKEALAIVWACNKFSTSWLAFRD